jgi:nucleoside phosphorylase
VTDLLLERLTAPKPEGASPGEISWPENLKPVPTRLGDVVDGPLPKVPTVVMAYTTAESEATADILTPGVHVTDWAKYTHNWSTLFKPHLTSRSPAGYSECMATCCLTEIGGQEVLVMKSDLHLSTDDDTLPVKALVKQIITETGCTLFITTGTAGGVGTTEVLGDVLITASAKFNCTETFKDQPWAQQRFVSGFQYDLSGIVEDSKTLKTAFSTLIPQAINGRLKESGYADRDPQIMTGDVETVDYFAFADTADSYDVVKDDPQVAMEEMDDAVIALAVQELEDADSVPVQWCSVRNASDPQMGGGPLSSQKASAEKIYERFGYFTTLASALACWALIAGMA